jgi:hypothetical protein
MRSCKNRGDQQTPQLTLYQGHRISAARAGADNHCIGLRILIVLRYSITLYYSLSVCLLWGQTEHHEIQIKCLTKTVPPAGLMLATQMALLDKVHSHRTSDPESLC